MPSNPLLSIWLHPRATIRDLKVTGSPNDVLIFAALSGIASTLDNAANRDFCDKFPLGGLLIFAALGGPIGGLITVWLGAMLIQFTGGFMKGIARTQEIRLALAWGLIPRTASLIPWAVVIATTGSAIFTSADDPFDDEPIGILISGFLALIAIIACNIWAFFTTCHALAEVQGYRSAWKALLNVVLAFLIFLAPFLLLGLVILLARKL